MKGTNINHLATEIHMQVRQFAFLNKTKESIIFQKLGSKDVWRTSNGVFNIGKSAALTLFNSRQVLCSAFDKAKLLGKN